MSRESSFKHFHSKHLIVLTDISCLSLQYFVFSTSGCGYDSEVDRITYKMHRK